MSVYVIAHGKVEESRIARAICGKGYTHARISHQGRVCRV
jgi:hypothetical protein